LVACAIGNTTPLAAQQTFPAMPRLVHVICGVQHGNVALQDESLQVSAVQRCVCGSQIADCSLVQQPLALPAQEAPSA
jgi:hypothetical protein